MWYDNSSGISFVKLFGLQKIDRWGFDTEVLFLIYKLGMNIKEMPVEWAHQDGSKVKPFEAAMNSFSELVRIKLNDLKGLYEI